MLTVTKSKSIWTADANHTACVTDLNCERCWSRKDGLANDNVREEISFKYVFLQSIVRLKQHKKIPVRAPNKAIETFFSE